MSNEKRNEILLASAKKNLKRMAFIGICEYQKISQYVFESVFKLKFLRPFIQLSETHSSLAIKKLNETMLQRIKELNSLDMELYKYACELLQERFAMIKSQDRNFDKNFDRASNLSIDQMSPEYRLMKKMVKLKKMGEQDWLWTSADLS